MFPPHVLRPGPRALALLLLPLLPGCDWSLGFAPPESSSQSDSDSSGTDSETMSDSVTEPPTGTMSMSDSDTTTDEPPACDMNGKCDPGEDTATCTDCTSCGNGEVDNGEECDDGNDDNTDACVSCNRPRCGDGFVQTGIETCDDGDDNSDAWSMAGHCKLDCSGPAPFCGDASCQLPDESINSCPQDGCKATCGNGVIEPGEQCDGGGANTDDCDDDCTTPMCGDNITNDAAGEDCDDGNADSTDACVSCKTAACGDGFVQAGVEQCDDGDPDSDDCSDDCEFPRRVFVTSETYKGDLLPAIDNKTGLALADAHCQALASAKLSGNFKAWLSDDTGSPSTRFDTNFTGAYQLVDGTSIVSGGWAELTSGNLKHAIDRDEQNNVLDEATPWSNTTSDGTKVTMDEASCMNWTSKLLAVSGRVGDSSAMDAAWSDAGAIPCSVPLPLYCFEDPL